VRRMYVTYFVETSDAFFERTEAHLFGGSVAFSYSVFIQSFKFSDGFQKSAFFAHYAVLYFVL